MRPGCGVHAIGPSRPRPEAVAFTLEVPGAPCLAWYHPPTFPWRDLAVVLCAPIGYEGVTSHATFLQIAHALADHGFPVLAFDYPGSGDSSGDEDGPGRVAAWRAGIDAAVAAARRLGPTLRVGLLGARLGGTLALDAASRLAGIDRVVLWGAPPDGRSFVRELQAAGRPGPGGSVHAMGQRYAMDTLVALARLRPLETFEPLGKRILVIDRDDLPGQGAPLLQALRRNGHAIDRLVVRGFADMVRGGTRGALEDAGLSAISDWFAAGCGASRSDPVPAWKTQVPVAWTSDGCRETLVRLGPERLCALLCEPAVRGPDAVQPTVVLLNDGENYHVGSHRLYVTLARRLARAGQRVVRMDFAGTGDSPASGDAEPPPLYCRSSVREVRSALDALTAEGHRSFVLMGLCSGSFLAFQTALQDRRVAGIALLNPRLLDWQHGPARDWQHSNELQVRSARAYGKALARPGNWQRLVRGELGLPWALNLARAVAAEAGHQLAWTLGRGRPTLRAMVHRLCRDGTDVLVLVADDDDALGYIEHHVGHAGRRMRGCEAFGMVVVPDADHTFSRPGNVDAVASQLVRFLGQSRDRRERPATAGGRLPAIVGTS